nr:alpha/beta fold hydrolase [Ancylobacter koreensis]
MKVVKLAAARDDVVFVTFESLQLERAPVRPGYGETFLQKRGYTGYHFLSAANCWYQYPEMPEALAVVRADIAAGARVITYGVSMGAYAAYRFSAPLAADAVIAFSPQWSMDPRRVWWERRWRSEGSARMWDRQLPCAKAAKYVFYDPLNQDRRHIRNLQREAPLDLVRLYFGGHHSPLVVQECGLLESVVLDIAENRFDRAAFERRLWQRRLLSETYRTIRRRKGSGLIKGLRYRLIEALIERRLGAGTGAEPGPLLPDRGGA